MFRLKYEKCLLDSFSEANILRIVDEKKWIGYMESFLAFLMSLLAHSPLFFKYEVIQTEFLRQGCNVTFEKYCNYSCWIIQPSKMALESATWEAYTVTFNAIIRVVPTMFIIFLNLQMYFEIKRLMFSRRNIRKKQDLPAATYQARLSIVSHNHLDTRGESEVSYDTIRKIINKW